MIVAIDGPSGAGKSTIAKAAAKRLGFFCLDTGAMYRAVSWQALKNSVSLQDEENLADIAINYEISFVENSADDSKRVFIGGREVTNDIRTSEIDKAVSPISAVPAVRKALVDQQRHIGSSGNYIVEGRDIATVVFPDAEVKIFLTASPEERAMRRVRQNEKRGVGSRDFDEVLAAIQRRDKYDSTRDTAPLRPADDATILDSTTMSIDQVVEKVCSLVESL